jgi:hypothetical protein
VGTPVMIATLFMPGNNQEAKRVATRSSGVSVVERPCTKSQLFTDSGLLCELGGIFAPRR